MTAATRRPASPPHSFEDCSVLPPRLRLRLVRHDRGLQLRDAGAVAVRVLHDLLAGVGGERRRRRRRDRLRVVERLRVLLAPLVRLVLSVLGEAVAYAYRCDCGCSTR